MSLQKQCCKVVYRLLFSDAKDLGEIPKGSPPMMVPTQMLYH